MFPVQKEDKLEMDDYTPVCYLTSFSSAASVIGSQYDSIETSREAVWVVGCDHYDNSMNYILLQKPDHCRWVIHTLLLQCLLSQCMNLMTVCFPI